MVVLFINFLGSWIMINNRFWEELYPSVVRKALTFFAHGTIKRCVGTVKLCVILHAAEEKNYASLHN